MVSPASTNSRQFAGSLDLSHSRSYRVCCCSGRRWSVQSYLIEERSNCYKIIASLDHGFIVFTVSCAGQVQIISISSGAITSTTQVNILIWVDWYPLALSIIDLTG